MYQMQLSGCWSSAAGGTPEQGQGYLQRAALQGACAGLHGAALKLVWTQPRHSLEQPRWPTHLLATWAQLYCLHAAKSLCQQPATLATIAIAHPALTGRATPV